MQSLKEKRLELFYQRFQEEYPHLTDEQAEEIKKYLSDSIDMAYEEGQDDCCVSKLGCLCNPIGGCNLDTCKCPDHYAKHEEWLKSLT